MIHTHRLIALAVLLTFALLVACEPLAPDQTPQYVIVTGETPDAIATAPAAPDVLSAAGTPTATTNSGGTVNTPQPSPTPLPAPTALPSATAYVCNQGSGRVIESSFYSTVAGVQVPYRMYQPPCFYDTFRRYPYVILLHGTGYDDAMWDDMDAPEVLDEGIANGILPPMVLIMPDGGLLAEYNNMPDGQSWESVVLDELIPLLEQDFCLWGSRQGRAIGGISRGGFWAFSIALRHPDLFSALGGHSPHFEEDNALPQYNPLALARQATFTSGTLRIYLDHAAGDYVRTNTQVMSDILNERGISHEYLIDPVGGHDMNYWSAHVAAYLQFYGQVWPLDPMSLPSCLTASP